MPEASPLWQTVFVVWCVVSVLWSMWAGWRKGVVRTVVSLGGLVAGGFVGVGVAAAAPALLGWLIPLPGIVIGAAAGLVVGVGVWLGIAVIGALLFKRTADQGIAPIRWLWGLGGALVGGAIGVTVVWGLLLFVRGAGAFAEARFLDVARYHNLPKPGAVDGALVRLKRSIEAGSMGETVAAIDVVPEGTYRVITKAGRVTVDPIAFKRLLEVPEVRAVVDDPKFLELAGDPDVEEATRTASVRELVTNPKIIALANDPGIAAKLRAIDLEKALDYALAEQPVDAEPSE